MAVNVFKIWVCYGGLHISVSEFRYVCFYMGANSTLLYILKIDLLGRILCVVKGDVWEFVQEGIRMCVRVWCLCVCLSTVIFCIFS